MYLVFVLLCFCVPYSYSGYRNNRDLTESEETGHVNNHEDPIDTTDAHHEVSIEDAHKYTALLDITFADRTRRTCTGTVIDDHVVVTAAHCFINKNNVNSEPELSLSFVVIGTKRMFETGYENYFPITQVVIHPQYKGWNADLALVFTYEGLASEYTATTVPLPSTLADTTLEANLTFLKWGARDASGTDVEFDPDVSSEEMPSISRSTQKCSTKHTTAYPVRRASRHINLLRKIQSNFNESQSRYKNRRIMLQRNKLSSHLFGFVNKKNCKAVVDKTMTAEFHLDQNYICYNSEEHVITDADAGAPVLNKNHLIAVTVGGVVSEGTYVAVGMKISCFCNWIYEHLTPGEHLMECCEHCCDDNHSTEEKI